MSATVEAMKPPQMKLSDIFIPCDEALKDKSVETINTSSSSTLGEPSVILEDWLYLGNRYHAKSRDILEQLQITHILNITATLPCLFPDIIQYSQIKVFDESTVKLYDYFEAAASFIDLCNPLNYDIHKEPKKRKRRILVHCAMGISRSATITISYLMSRPVLLSEAAIKILDHIQAKLEQFDQEIEAKIKSTNINGINGWNLKTFEQHRQNKDFTKRTRANYSSKSHGQGYEMANTSCDDESEDVDEGDQNALPLRYNGGEQKTKEEDKSTETKTVSVTMSTTETADSCDKVNVPKGMELCTGLTLGEAYLFVQARRDVICPNTGFCHQLEMWEKYVWDNSVGSTLYQIPFFKPDLNQYSQQNGRNKGEENIQCSKECCVIL